MCQNLGISLVDDLALDAGSSRRTFISSHRSFGACTTKRTKPPKISNTSYLSTLAMRSYGGDGIGSEARWRGELE